MASLAVTRHIECDGVFNVRDLGGYATADGASVRWRTLYRADGLHRATDPGHPSLTGLGWRTVLDLRTAREVEAGAYRYDGTDVVHLPVLERTWDDDGLTVDGDAVTFLVDRYLDMLESGRQAFVTAFDILATPGRTPAVFHCSAGKDRTGVLAALVLSALGVPDDTIATDYALSGRAMERLVDWYRERHPEAIDAMVQQPPEFLSCPGDAMLRFLAEVADRHGSAEEYLLSAGVRPAVMADVRAALLEQ